MNKEINMIIMFGISPNYSYTVVRQTNTHFDALSASQVGVAFAVSLALVSTIIIIDSMFANSFYLHPRL